MKNLSLEKGTVDNYILARSREKKAGIELLKAEFKKETQDDFLIRRGGASDHASNKCNCLKVTLYRHDEDKTNDCGKI